MADRAIPNLSLGTAIVDPQTGRPTAIFVQAFNDLILRTGGQGTDKIAVIADVALQASANAAAINAGAATGFTLDPKDPLGFTTISAANAQIFVVAHTRTESGIVTPLPAAAVATPVALNATYYVYYSTPGTYLATTDPAVASDPAVKLITSIPVIEPPLIASDSGGEFPAGFSRGID